MILDDTERYLFFFQAEDGIRDRDVTGVQTCALPLSTGPPRSQRSGGPGQAEAALVNGQPSTGWGPRQGPHTPNVRAAPAKPRPPSSTVSRVLGGVADRAPTPTTFGRPRPSRGRPRQRSAEYWVRSEARRVGRQSAVRTMEEAAHITS